MRVLVNALSVTNLSGRHVLYGHLTQLAERSDGRHQYVVLHHAGNSDMQRDLGPQAEWVECPGLTAHWLGRFLWEQSCLAKTVKSLRGDLVLTLSGVAGPSLGIPQAVYAMNPWCLVPGLERSPSEALKAMLQRRAYRRTMAVADTMVFLSDFLRQAYRSNAGFEERHSEVVYTGIEEETYATAAQMTEAGQRKPNRVLCVSVMAPHKDIETVVQAIHRVRSHHGVPAELALVGPWADRRYEARARSLVQELGLDSVVELTGHVSREELHQQYALGQVFCLMSRCESFGIPAIEAQAFGTPVVSSNCCAIPEVCGAGGVYPPVGDVDGVATQLARLLSDRSAWSRFSEAAIENAARYHWSTCSQPLLRMFDAVAQ